MDKMAKPELNVSDFIEGIKNLVIDENEFVSKSPMRTHDCHHCSKPYGYPQGSTSRSAGGVTRVVEADGSSRSDAHRTFQSFSWAGIANETDPYQDVGIGDINHWLSICSKDPRFIKNFIEDCNKELSNDSPSYVGEGGSFMTVQQSRGDGVSICSNSSSQISSPAQSPSEHNVTSPESVGCEESSFYHPMSPIISPLESINIKPVDDVDDINRLLGFVQEEHAPVSYAGCYGSLDAADKAATAHVSPSVDSATPNIGTVLLNLATDTYESTIDLSQITETRSSDVSFTYCAVEKESLNRKLDPKAKQRAWTKISQVNIDSLGKGDKEGDTQLIIALASWQKGTLEYIYVIVERLLKDGPDYLSSRNEMNQDALYLAALLLKWGPLVASYIAEALVRGRQDVNRKYEDGNTLLHLLAQRGDTHAQVLERLLRLRTQENLPAFDINKKNNKGLTPLHVACERHKSDNVVAYETVRVLLENGADCTEKEYIDENTPLHVLLNASCDTELLKILLENSSKFWGKDDLLPTRIANRQGDTALHLACKRNTLEIPVQKAAVEILLKHGAMIQLKNINGRVPSVLVDSSRKPEIKSILHSFRHK